MDTRTSFDTSSHPFIGKGEPASYSAKTSTVTNKSQLARSSTATTGTETPTPAPTPAPQSSTTMEDMPPAQLPVAGPADFGASQDVVALSNTLPIEDFDSMPPPLVDAIPVLHPEPKSTALHLPTTLVGDAGSSRGSPGVVVSSGSRASPDMVVVGDDSSDDFQ